MPVSITISDTAKALAESLVAKGRFETIDEAVEAAIWRLDLPQHELIDLDHLSPEHRAAVERGLADAAGGRTVDGEEFFAKLIAKYQAMVKAA